MSPKRGVLFCVALAVLAMAWMAHAATADAQSPTNDGFGTSKRGDFNGDGRNDIVTFTRGSTYKEVFVALSDGKRFNGTGVKWGEFFALDSVVPEVGDFNCDGRDDIVTFSRGSKADAFVILSDGQRFKGTGDRWHESFAVGNEVPMVGDFNGDGCDDIATFTRGVGGDVFVALSNGHDAFVGTGVKWHDSFAVGNEIPAVGDFNGDGRDDIVTFTPGQGPIRDVFVALSDGKRFNGNGVNWLDTYLYGVPAVGDFNGDGRDDIAIFERGSVADVFVALSDGNRFNLTHDKWHDHFAVGTELPGTGDFNGDGRDDIITFTRGSAADVFVALSTGKYFNGSGVKWHDSFAFGDEIPAPAMIW